MQQTYLDYINESLIVYIDNNILPKSNYMFIEYYCCDQQCDCNSGAFLLVQLDSQGKETANRIALIDYTWTEPISCHNPILTPEFIGSRLAEAGLDEFKKLLATDKDIITKLKNAYSRTREENKGSYNKNQQVDSIKNMTKVGRNEPCPCGSGKKFKRCCL